MSPSDAITSPWLLTLHLASSLLFFWMQLEILVGLTSFLENLANVCLLGAFFSFLQKSGIHNM